MSFLSSKTITLGAAGTVSSIARLAVSGRFWFCTAATGEFYIGKMRDGEPAPFSLGLGYELPANEPDFHSLQLENRTGAAVTVTLMIGTGKLTDSRLNVVTTQLIATLAKDSPTLVKTGAAQTIAANTTIVLPGTVNAGGLTRRKSIVVTNLDAAADLDIRDSAGTNIATVFPKQAWINYTDADLQIRNNNGAILGLRVMELFYTS